jgi:hypothetical protein
MRTIIDINLEDLGVHRINDDASPLFRCPPRRLSRDVQPKMQTEC